MITRRLAAVVLIAGTSLASAADREESYRRALTAVEQNQWLVAIEALKQAIDASPKEGGTVRIYGMRFEDYLPHYYLGLAYSKSGDCAAAVREWAISTEQAAVKKTGRWTDLQRDHKVCQQKLAAAPPPTTPPGPPSPASRTGPEQAALEAQIRAVEGELQNAEREAAAVSRLAGDAALSRVWSDDSNLGPAQAVAGEFMTLARERLSEGRATGDAAKLQAALDLAKRASTQVQKVHRAAQARREALAPPPRSQPAPTVAPRTGPPALLVDAARAFFSGNYQDVVRLLDRSAEQSLSDPRERSQVLLLRAAARHSLYMLGGQADAALLRSVEEDVRSCRGVSPQVSLDPRAFSPRFRRLFETTAPSAAR